MTNKDRTVEFELLEKRVAELEKQARAVILVICDFCGLSIRKVSMLIAGHDVHICNECVDLCGSIVAEWRAKRGA